MIIFGVLRSAFAAVRLAFALLLVSAAAACSADNHAVFHTAKGDFAFTVEIAADSEQRAQGLMNRKDMADDGGMLFDFGTTRRVYMWMKDTYLPLDMLFLNQNGAVVSITPDTVPLSEAGG